MPTMNAFVFREMDEASARQIAGWRYPPPYDLYHPAPDAAEAFVQGLLTPHFRYYTVWDGQNELIAFRCFGEDAQVPGGDYGAEALDMGGGLRPDLTGQGLGASLLEAALEFAEQQFAPRVFRVTVAAFNRRALRVCVKVGFQPVQTFLHSTSGQAFVVLLRAARTKA